MLEAIQRWFDVLDTPFLKVGGSTFTYLGILKIIVYPTIAIFVALLTRRVLRKMLAKNHRLDEGVRNAITSITYYIVLVAGLAFALDSAGIHMEGLAIFSGGLGIGLGIGLQDIARNFVAGLILLISRPVRPGDRLVIDNLEGNVDRIGTYSTQVQTIQDATVVVPNSDLLNARLINWTLNARRRMLFVPVGVHYDSDVDQVIELMKQAAANSPDILSNPAPEVFLSDFGDSSINFEISVWTETQVFRPKRLVSQYNVEIVKLFQEHGVVIPYPQRDVHIKSRPQPVLE
ncbi:MAG TPA: mechanosensitive ion channel domain-containing protein [Fimbriimonadaceae bacterium]|nr:mechanosensitive ion channel domain-containing protein [Fimbriimonadaceae bacterium]